MSRCGLDLEDTCADYPREEGEITNQMKVDDILRLRKNIEKSKKERDRLDEIIAQAKLRAMKLETEVNALELILLLTRQNVGSRIVPIVRIHR